jgi:hypothetical protein
MTTSIISAIRDYIADYAELDSDAPVWVDYIGPKPTEYSVVPLAGSRVVEAYINGSTLREYPFAFRSMESTADDLARLENNGFFEAFADWLDSQTESDAFPTMNTGQTPELIEALGWGYLYEQGESETGIYQIQCRLVYKQD